MAEQQNSGSGWDDYVKYLKSEGKVEECHILGKDEGQVWASSTKLDFVTSYTVEVDSEENPDVKEKVTYNERDALFDGFANGGYTQKKGGIRIDKIKYYSVKMDLDRCVWYLKREDGGACVALTNRVILIGTYNVKKKDNAGKFQNPGDCNKKIEDMAAHLLGQGY